VQETDNDVEKLKVNHCKKTEKRNIDKTREPTCLPDRQALKPTRCFLFFAHSTFFKTIADPHCTSAGLADQSPTSQRYNQSFVKECNFANTQEY